jgi:hypothetical protein
MKFIEHQLQAALAETPIETDCSVSVAVLEMIGHHDRDAQEQWLREHRSPKEGKRWYLTGERWEYSEKPSVPIPSETSFSVPETSNWRTAPAMSDRKVTPIVVRPVTPLPRRK